MNRQPKSTARTGVWCESSGDGIAGFTGTSETNVGFTGGLGRGGFGAWRRLWYGLAAELRLGGAQRSVSELEVGTAGMAKKTIEHIEVASKRVLMRVDFNVPLDDDGAITDDRRIRLALPSIQSVVQRQGRLILISHLGRPDGTGYEARLSLKPVADRLGELIGDVAVRFVGGDCVGAEAAEAATGLGDGQVIVLENLRFNPGENAGDAPFAAQLAGLGDVYCNEAFGTAHRDDASMVALPKAMNNKPKVAGLLLEREIRFLGDTLAEPARPFVAVLGGAKVSDKLGAIRNLMTIVDVVLVGGAMAYTLLEALGRDVGSSKVQRGMLGQAQQIIDAAAASPVDLILPLDHVCGKQISRVTPVRVVGESIPQGWMGLDIGPETVAQYVRELSKAKTIVWNGPVGVVEVPPFDVGTKQIAQAMVRATEAGATSIGGGGDTAAAIEGFGLSDRFTHVSTGGGACLRMLEGQRFTSVDLLDEAD